MPVASFTRAVAVVAAGLIATAAGHAEQFPSKPIKIVVGFAPGSATDTIARLYGNKLSELLKTPVIVDNKAGGNQMNAIGSVRMSPPDGYTLYAATGSALAMNPAVRKDLPYDPLRDFSFIAFMAVSPGLITVNAALPIRTMEDLVNYAKAKPDALSFGSAGTGSAGHLGGEYLMRQTGIKMVHVPYKSDSEVMREVAAGTVHVGFTTAQFAVPLVGAGKVRAVAADAGQRMSSLPDVPTVAEVKVKGLESLPPYTYFGLVAPAGLPAPVSAMLNEAFNKITAMPDVAKQLHETLQMQPASPLSPEEFKAFVLKEMTKWREVGKNLRLE
jgi:tripartite-type tricarboxylate transporter receptor subunit TctC